MSSSPASGVLAVGAIVRVRRKPPRFGSCTQGERGCVAASPLGPVFCGPHGPPSVAHLYVVPPGALRGGKDEPTWPCCFSRYVRVAARLAFAIVNNLYCIPAYVVWMMALRLARPLYAPLYWRIEGLMYHWLLAMVSLWTWTAGYENLYKAVNGTMVFRQNRLRSVLTLCYTYIASCARGRSMTAPYQLGMLPHSSKHAFRVANLHVAGF
ncbi:unnamed protein product [Pieris macdunnoughi]|uniref:Uncharacterized protein n=1 Tax=Pieris macdunnoughi TaxID=345717 RepID=A0A821QT13_9NEOP|nr:unnamed protein product [Pieris macdunnoughi]